MTTTLRYGQLTESMQDYLCNNEDWISFKKRCEAKNINNDPRIEMIVNKCLEHPTFKEDWEKLREDFTRYPDLKLKKDNKKISKLPLYPFNTTEGPILLIGPPKILLLENNFPSVAIFALALEVFKFGSLNKEELMDKMRSFCTEERLSTAEPAQEDRPLLYPAESPMIKIQYMKGSRIPEVIFE